MLLRSQLILIVCVHLLVVLAHWWRTCVCRHRFALHSVLLSIVIVQVLRRVDFIELEFLRMLAGVTGRAMHTTNSLIARLFFLRTTLVLDIVLVRLLIVLEVLLVQLHIVTGWLLLIVMHSDRSGARAHLL